MLGMPNRVNPPLFMQSQQRNKVADYPFTTRYRASVLCVWTTKGFVVADIPGLIEGAEGAGLGIRFLKHLERCRVLLHLIDIEPIDAAPIRLRTRGSLSVSWRYSETGFKPRWLVFNRST